MARYFFSFCLLGFATLLNIYGIAQAAPAGSAGSDGLQQSSPPVSPQTRIVGGQTARAGQFPWQVGITQDNAFFCGGSIIHSNWILTAGHCTFRVLVFSVTVGTLFSGTAPQSILEPNRQTIITMIGVTHPLYIPNNLEDNNDIGLVFLPRPLIFTPFVNAIPLATLTPEFLLLDLKNVTISGWGKTSDDSKVSQRLMYTDLTVIPGPACGLVYNDVRMDQKICCGTFDGHSTCNGDSGGPLIYHGLDGKDHEVGIVAYGSESCTRRVPVVFTRVTSYLPFIFGITGLRDGESPSTVAFPILRSPAP